MIIGIGIDLIEIERIKKACAKEAFLLRSFTSAEIECIGGRAERAPDGQRRRGHRNFAVKEAVSKAMGTGFRGMSLNEIEVLRDDLGKPFVRLYGRAGAKAAALGIARWHVSISNTKTRAEAYVIGEGVEE